MKERFYIEAVPLAGVSALALFDQQRPKQNPIVVDFESAQLRFRRRGGVDGEMVVKSFGLAPRARAGSMVIDCSAGLGTDAYLLALAGYRVIAVERNPLVFEILQDGWRRLQAARKERGDGELDFRVCFSEASSILQQMISVGERPYGVYFDPMFEDETKKGKSLPRKEMATLRDLLADAENQGQRPTEFLRYAISVASGRVVVKRPSGAAPALVDPGPANRIEGKVAGYDIYSCRVAMTQE